MFPNMMTNFMTAALCKLICTNNWNFLWERRGGLTLGQGATWEINKPREPRDELHAELYHGLHPGWGWWATTQRCLPSSKPQDWSPSLKFLLLKSLMWPLWKVCLRQGQRVKWSMSFFTQADLRQLEKALEGGRPSVLQSSKEESMGSGERLSELAGLLAHVDTIELWTAVITSAAHL